MVAPRGVTNLGKSRFGHLPLISATQGLGIFKLGNGPEWCLFVTDSPFAGQKVLHKIQKIGQLPKPKNVQIGAHMLTNDLFSGGIEMKLC